MFDDCVYVRCTDVRCVGLWVVGHVCGCAVNSIRVVMVVGVVGGYTSGTGRWSFGVRCICVVCVDVWVLVGCV